MNITKFPSLSCDKSSLKARSVTQFVAVGSLAIGIAAGVSVAPSQAAILNGQLDFTGGAQDFAGSTVNFNTVATVTNTIGDFTALTPVGSLSSNIPTPANFTVSGSNYTLNNNLTFSFNSGVDFTIGSGSVFSLTTIPGTGNFLTISSDTGSFFTQGGIITNASLDAAIIDFTRVNGAFYNITARTIQAVPEPFTVIGTLIGGTAAFRMRKKLSSAKK